MRFSSFGDKFAAKSGIGELMEDLGHALAGGDMIMMGGGNPAHIPAVQERFKQRLTEIIDSPSEFRRLVGIYDPPQGELSFIRDVSDMLNREFSWDLKPDNIALTNGSQAGFFMLFNLFAGQFNDGSHKQIQLPLAPEYIGYSDAGLSQSFFTANRPKIEHIDSATFKYHVDFDALNIDETTGAICVSRPTNPTGNVLTDDEIDRLDQVARENNIPLILDCAYGTPFPNLIFTEARPIWNDNIIACFSLSKLGLPAARTGIVVANAEVIKALSAVNGIMNLATGSFGAMLAQDMVRSGEILRISNTIVRPFYLDKAKRAEACLRQYLQGTPFALHKAEGAMFLWLWLRDCPVTSQALYERLKARGVLVVPGHHFFPGLESGEDKNWRHKHECLRITYSQDDALVERGLAIIGEEVKKAYAE